jgi:hypothetical protein
MGTQLYLFITLFPKLKIELKERRIETVSDIQKELQVVLDSIRENDFHSAFEGNGIQN